MANQLYAKGREGFLDGSIDWDSDTIKAVACDATYTPSFSADDFLSDIPVGGRISTSAALTGKTKTDGVADADDVAFLAVTAGKTINRIVLYKDTGTPTTSRLIGSIDTLSTGTALSVPTSGGDILFRWSNGANRIFRL